MADYYPLISRAVAGLEKSTGENRRALYERARKALVDQLRGVQPALSETDITRERLALEEAIRKVETEAARQMRQASMPLGKRRTEEQARATPPDEADSKATQGEGDDAARPASDAPPPGAIPVPEDLRPTERPLLDKKHADSGDGIKGFSDVVADAESLGDAVAQAGRSAREAFTQVPSPSPEFDRLEPRVVDEPQLQRPRPPERPRRQERPLAERARPQGQRTSERPRPPRPGAQPTPRPDLGPVIGEENEAQVRPLGKHSLEPPAMPDSLRYVADRARRAQEDEAPPLRRRMVGGVIKTIVLLLVFALLGGTVYWQWPNLSASFERMVAMVRSPSAPPAPPREANNVQRKITDRIGQPETPQQQEAPVAQRVVLYEEDPADSAGKRFVGNVVWRVENVAPGPGQQPDRVVRADITVPERDMQVTWTLRRNFDKDLQASHTISVQFSLPPDFVHGEIAEIRGVLMKPAEQVRGVSLAGIAVKVTSNFFLIGLTAAETEVQRNIQALKERPWFDIALVYKDGRRAILAVEKGTPGERAFNETFAAWGQ